MTSEAKKEYTLRITQANSSQLVVIIYEMLLDYLKDAKENLNNDDISAFHDSIRHATGCIRELTSSINYDNPISGNLLSLNIFCVKELAKADVHHRYEEICNVELIIGKLYEAYKEAAKKDASTPIMQNTQQVYAGLTYGKESLVVNLNGNANRGYKI